MVENGDMRDVIAGLSDKELIEKYVLANKTTFGTQPYPFYGSSDMIYFTLLADEMSRRGFKGRGIDGLEAAKDVPGEPGSSALGPGEEDLSSQAGVSERKYSGAQLVVDRFCKAIIEERYSAAAEYCFAATAEEVIEDFGGGPGVVRGFRPLERMDSPDREINGELYSCCTVDGNGNWEYEGELEVEEWTFTLVRVGDDWKIFG